MELGSSSSLGESLPQEVRRAHSSEQDHVTNWYQMADAALALTATDQAFQQRFAYLFQECRCLPGQGEALPHLGLQIGPADGDRLAAVFTTPDPIHFHQAAALALAEAGVSSHFMLDADRVEFPRSAPWQGVIASIAVNEVLRIQKHMLFFHAGTVAITGRGVMLVGDKGMGKTTLSLALAARGCGFLGDEYAALDTRTLDLVPFRRAVSIRPGATARRVSDFLATGDFVTDRTPDGTRRARLSVAAMIPAPPPSRTRLTHIFFLRSFAGLTRIESFYPGTEHLPLLRPLLPTLSSAVPGTRVMQMTRMMAAARCFHLDLAGSPDEAAEQIQRTVEAT